MNLPNPSYNFCLLIPLPNATIGIKEESSSEGEEQHYSMQVYPAELADLNPCHRLNGSYTTDYVWQMQTRQTGHRAQGRDTHVRSADSAGRHAGGAAGHSARFLAGRRAPHAASTRIAHVTASMPWPP